MLFTKLRKGTNSDLRMVRRVNKRGTQRWEFIKENKKVKKKENSLSSKKATKKIRKNDNGQEEKKENKPLIKK